MAMRLSPAMEAGLLAISWQLVTRKSLAVLPVKGNTANALEDRGLIKATVTNTDTGIEWTLTDAGITEVDRIQHERDAESAAAIRAARDADAEREATADETWRIPRDMSGAGKVCKRKPSLHGHRAKWRKGR